MCAHGGSVLNLARFLLLRDRYALVAAVVVFGNLAAALRSATANLSGFGSPVDGGQSGGRTGIWVVERVRGLREDAVAPLMVRLETLSVGLGRLDVRPGRRHASQRLKPRRGVELCRVGCALYCVSGRTMRRAGRGRGWRWSR